MATYTLTKAERETHILWNDADPIAVCDTASPATIRLLDALTEAYPDTFRCVRVDPLYNAKRYEFHHGQVDFKKPASEARRRASRANADKARKALKKSFELEEKSDLSLSPEEIVD